MTQEPNDFILNFYIIFKKMHGINNSAGARSAKVHFDTVNHHQK